MITTTKSAVQAFQCWVVGYEEYPTTIYATSIGKAKARYCVEARDWHPDVAYLDIRAKRARRSAPVTTDAFRRVADSRGIPFARVGMRVRVGDDMGTIVGHNRSANLNVLFDDGTRYGGEVLNCHPNWKVTYFDEAGEVIEAVSLIC